MYIQKNNKKRRKVENCIVLQKISLAKTLCIGISTKYYSISLNENDFLCLIYTYNICLYYLLTYIFLVYVCIIILSLLFVLHCTIFIHNNNIRLD